MNVVCVKWGNKYGADYVLKLKRACAKHVPQPHSFICFTDVGVPDVECRPLPSDLPTWWSKVGLFKPGVLTGATLYLDLDVVLTASLQPAIDAFNSEPDYLWTLDDFGYPLLNPRPFVDPHTSRLLGGVGTVNSSLMIWRGNAGRRIWDEFEPRVMDELHGDQNWITRAMWPDRIKLLPAGIAGSYKYGGGQAFPVTVFHGDPKPADVRDEWVMRCWA